MKHLVRILLVLMVSLPMSLFAQSDDETTLDDIENAFANIFKNESVRLEGTTTLEQTITLSGQTVEQIMTQNAVTDMVFENSQMTAFFSQTALSLTTENVPPSFNGAVTIEMILVDEQLYLRGINADGIFVDIYPAEWVNTDDNADALGDLADFLNVDTLMSQMITPLQYPLDEVTVASFEATTTDTLAELPDGTRAYRLDMNIEVIFEYMNLDSLFASFEQLGIDMDELINQMLQSAVQDLVIYIVDEQVIYIESQITINAPITVMGQSVKLEQTATSVFRYINFNEPIEIIAPEL